MARKSTKKEDNFKEFEYDGKEFKYTGRIYPDSTKEGKKCNITSMNLCLNGVITIKFCKLFQSDKNTWISFPQYETKKGDYENYFFIEKEFSEKELSKVAEAAEKALDD